MRLPLPPSWRAYCLQTALRRGRRVYDWARFGL